MVCGWLQIICIAKENLMPAKFSEYSFENAKF